MLDIRNLHARVVGQKDEILRGLDLKVEAGEDGTLAYRTLVAPTLAPADFEELYETASRARTRCLHAAKP